MSSPNQSLGQPDISPRDSGSGDNETSDSDSESPSKVATEDDHPTLSLKMLNFGKEITIMVFVVFAYAAFTNESLPKVSQSPAAYPFFPKGSVVTDWYRGEITRAIEQARSSDIAFVMFYAPWDAESQMIRGEFELAAKYMHTQVTFAAVNCWQPDSECKNQYAKVYKWPVLIAYPTHGRGIQYNGPLDAAHMIKFLQNLCRPLVLPHSVNELISKHDAVVLGNINSLPGSYEYAVFYRTALRFLERDPFQEITFAVVPQNQEQHPKLHLYLWNETISYNGDWDPEAVLTWIYKNLHQITGWIAPTGTKSLSLSSYVQPGPALILFTPKNPFFQQNDYYSMLKEVAYEYYNCANNNIVTLKQRLIHVERLKNYLNYRDLKQKCLRKHNKHFKNVAAQVPNVWTNSTIKNCKDCTICTSECFNFGETVERICNNNDPSAAKISMLTGWDDPRSPQNLQKWSREDSCRNFLLGQNYEPPVFVKNDETDVNLAGLACKSNRSLALIAMDSLRYHHFAEKLGINLFEAKDKTRVVIINDKLESHHVMEEVLTSANLKLFIQNFTQGSLTRALHSNPQLKSRNTHVYPQANCDFRQNQFCVAELNTENFVPTVMQLNKAVVVFYYSKQCSFCNGVAYTFLTTAKALSIVDNIVFARIDGDLNLLPWEYTMESYPTILFFPSVRKSESRAFPRNVPITVPNILGFILTNLEPRLKLHVMWSICHQRKFEDRKSDCIATVRAETLSVIDKTLKEWRSVGVRQRAEILHKLQLLRHLHLLFAHSPSEVVGIQRYLGRLNHASDTWRIKDEL